MSGKHVLIVLFAVAAGGFVYPLAAQQGPTIPQPNPAASQPAPGANQPVPNQPVAPVPGRPGVVPRQAPTPPIPGAPVPPTGPLSQPEPSAAVPPVEQAPPGQPGAPGPQPGSGPVFQGRRALQPPAAGGMVSLNFNRADLIEIIHIIAQQLRLTYTIDPEVKGTVTINSAEPLRSEDLLPIFHQLLRMNGAVAVRTGNLYHIMPIKDGKGLARPIGQGREDSFALQIIPVRFFSVAEMKKVLTPFLQPGAEIIENPRGNFLVVMDLPSNIQRLMEIADMIDVQVFAGTRMEIYPPKVASAEELSVEMTKIMQSFASSAPQSDTFTAQFIPLPRINQLLVISHSEAAWTYARRWLERIDVVAEGPGRRIFIYAVENGKAAELADVLSQALGQPSTGKRDNTPTLQDIHRSTAGGGTNPATGRSTMGSNFGSSSSSSSGSFGQQRSNTGSAFATVPVPGQVPAPGLGVPPQTVPPQAPGAPRPAGQAGQAQQPQQPPEQLRIVPDPATNSLIIYGTAQEFQNIKNILKDLDAIPRQVLIEAMVLQVDLSDSESLGVDFEIFRGSRTIFGQAFSSRGAFRTLGDLFPAAPGFGPSSGLSGIVGGQDLRAMIRVLATDSRVKLLSSPSVLAADNRPARIQVGSEEPVPTGTISAAVGGVAQSTSIQYRNTGRILTIIPQVNSRGLVNLQIKAEVSARGDDVNFGASGETFPSFNTQDAETTAVVHDGDALVIGGLIGERRSKTRNGIPYLMDIPVFGRFFGTTSDNNQRTELIMMITPRVIRTRAESVVVTDEFLSKLSTVRTELERIARDQEKMRPKPAPDQAPPMPVPPPAYDAAPAPSPNRLLPGAGASIAPLTDNTVAPNGRATAQVAIATPIPVAARAAQVQPLSIPARPVEIPSIVAQTSQARATTEPAYALSVVKQKVEMTKIPVAKPAEAPVKTAPSKMWTVQVASSVVQKEAEKLANQLRKEGYDSYVAVAEIGTKTWHRVRIGQLKSLNEAMELRRDLINLKSFQTAYIATR
ncbi:MAG: type II secretion system secretin GspD [Candidatus Binatia bacterium]